MNLFSPFFFSKFKKNFDGESISAALWKRQQTSAPWAFVPSRSLRADLLDSASLIWSQLPVDSNKLCHSTISISRSLIDLVMSSVTLRMYCWQSCFLQVKTCKKARMLGQSFLRKQEPTSVFFPDMLRSDVPSYHTQNTCYCQRKHK